MEDKKLDELIKKVRSIPHRREVYSIRHQQSFPFLRVVTNGNHKGVVFFSGIKMPTSNIEDILPDAAHTWDEWESSRLFKSREKVIDSHGKIVPHSIFNDEKYISFAMKPEDYHNNTIPGELLFARIEGKGNYLIIPASTTKDGMTISIYKTIDNSPALKGNSSALTINFSNFELIRPAIQREIDYFYGKVSNTDATALSTSTKTETLNRNLVLNWLKENCAEKTDVIYLETSEHIKYLISEIIYGEIELYTSKCLNLNTGEIWTKRSKDNFISFDNLTHIRKAYSHEIKDFKKRFEPKEIENTPIDDLRPFKTKVLVANEVNDYWLPAIFGTYIDKPNGGRYAVVGGQTFKRCIIYKGENKKLLGKQVKMKSL